MIYLMNEDQEYIAFVCICTTEEVTDASHFETVEHAERFKEVHGLWDFEVVEQ